MLYLYYISSNEESQEKYSPYEERWRIIQKF
nr:MAG TPA: hypothetical protein [Caudoviricetes sp.]